MKKLLIPLALSIIALCSCNILTSPIENNSSSDINSENSGDLSDNSNSDSSNDGDEIPFKYDNKDYNDFFDPTKDVRVNIRISNQAVYKLAKYGVGTFNQQETYHPCDCVITIDGEERLNETEVGIRMKGNTSKNGDFVNSDGTFYEPIHYKLAFNKNFAPGECDYYQTSITDSNELKARKKRKFGDMKKIDFKWNRNSDETFTKEAYAKECYRDAGVVAQRMNLVKFTITSDSDSYSAIYQVSECIDGSMLHKYYGKEGGAGNLYKGLYGRADFSLDSISGQNLDPESETNQYPNYPLKTNDDGPTYDHHLMQNVVQNLNKTQNAEEAKKDLDNILDVDNILRYAAVSWIVGNPDDLRNDANNTYFYFNSINNKMSIIPYDDDRVFGILNTWPVDMSTLPCDSTRMQGMSYVYGKKVWVSNPLFWKLIINESDNSVDYSDKWPVIQEYQERYIQYVKEFANKYLDVNRFQQFTNKFVNAQSKNIEVVHGNNQRFSYYASTKLANMFK